MKITYQQSMHEHVQRKNGISRKKDKISAIFEAVGTDADEEST